MITRWFPEQAQEPGIENRDGSGVSSGHHLDACLWEYSGQVQLGGNPDSEYTRGITHPTWSGQDTGSHRNTLEMWLGGRTWALPCLACTHYNRVPTRVRRWMELQCVCAPFCIHTFFRCIERHRPALWEYCVPNGDGHYHLCLGLIHHHEVCLCVCVSLCVCLAETDKDPPSTQFCWHLSIKAGKALAEIDSGGCVFAHT